MYMIMSKLRCSENSSTTKERPAAVKIITKHQNIHTFSYLHLHIHTYDFLKGSKRVFFKFLSPVSL